MTYTSPYGRPEGIAHRLIEWRRTLGADRTYPWAGTGLLDDLVCAAAMLGADVSEFEPDDRQPELEFDL